MKAEEIPDWQLSLLLPKLDLMEQSALLYAIAQCGYKQTRMVGSLGKHEITKILDEYYVLIGGEIRGFESHHITALRTLFNKVEKMSD